MANPPIHRLATELLSHVFSFCPSSFDDFRKSPEITDRENGAVALRVSHVSRHWRAVSHVTPSLWRTITVISPSLGDEGCDEELLKPHAERVNHYLDLSGDLPLRIVLDNIPSWYDSEYYDGEMEKHRFAVMDCLILPLICENYRWESFYAKLQYFFDSSFQFGLAVPMPFLTELHLIHEGPLSYTIVLPSEAPKLERLTIYRLKLRDTENIPCFPPNSALRYISVGGIELHEAVPIINAVSADMAVELVGIKSHRSGEPFTCSSYTLSISVPGELAEVLAQLTLASSVNTLEFCFEKASASPFPLGSFKGMLKRSSSTKITNFALRYSCSSDTRLLNLLAALPCLTHLTIEEHPEAQFTARRKTYLPPSFSNAFFDVLADSEHDNDSMTFTYNDPLAGQWWLDHFGEEKPFDVSLCPLLPRLTNLVLVFHLSSITENTVKMVESRVRPASEGIARVRFVSLHYHGDLLDEKSRLGLKNPGETEGLELDVRQLKS